MAIKKALRQSRILTFGLLFVTLWLLFTLYRVATSFDWTAIANPTFIGLNPVGGIMGVIVMALLVMLVFAMYGEMSEEEPAPQPWPPKE